MHNVPICKIIQFSDQAPSQYKNKSVFRYVTQVDLPTMLNFFRVCHGKGPCNGSAGRVKQRIANLVKTETVVINNANDFYDACKKHLEMSKTEGSCTHYIQEFEFMKKLATRPNMGKWTTVPDTHKLHSVTNVVGMKKINIK